MKKAIFGGTFDPIHIGHIHIAYEALYSLKLDKILFMPAGNPPNKLNKQITDSKIRYDLVNKAIEGEINFEISDYEINKKENSYTYETIELFSKLQSNTEWYFLIGADSLIDLDNWKNVDRLLNGCQLVVYNRAGFALEKILKQKKSLESKYHNKIIFLDMPIIDISSTSIRESIKEGRNINYLLPKGVEKIVEKFKLYK
ncbi:nicotinate-nucleotide adenylyltransferase [Clostridium estertheticum]|uniref:Probable nicotinate-nucleotide adenylyltransferase n=1 Tax=Clostridium estertheticum TaxID=238834 RepID=A0A7Y3SVM2_9CLOT|nr:nicotinate-nucleotide adenylyltransferase [Clostridium estertheticum]MBW9169835.1 nicotinate-nucleotide adenylyltransferase [Clostridium estertheticum]NNU75843.1 nicotinate-nucleotide adenylyltransferase [Clostridium estertheticum]WBL46526.1 nicotinate-nucleotide adenylyltransferase [Clostridium estertheticum]WLC74667.1 nicotinate-nucleotide adenylyltransferase [Clostridium estertheticum]